MDQLSVFDKEDLKIFYFCKRTLPFSSALGLWEKWNSRCRRHWMDIDPPLYIISIFIYNIYFSIMWRCFFRDWLSKLPRMVLIKKTTGVYYKGNERRDHQKTKPAFAADLCHGGSFSRSGTGVLSGTTTVAVTSPLFVGLVVFSTLETSGSSAHSK